MIAGAFLNVQVCTCFSHSLLPKTLLKRTGGGGWNFSKSPPGNFEKVPTMYQNPVGMA